MSGSGSGTPIPASPAFVVEDGTGKTDANSYLSVDGADTYHTSFTMSAEWSGAALAAKQNALIVAAQYLDAEYGGRWRGYRAHDTQALAWPRSCVEDDDGYAVDGESVPQKLKDACAELALRVVLGDSLLGVVTEPGSIASESKSLGPLSKTVTYVAGRPAGGYQYPKVEALLKSLILAGGGVFRG